jgi:hypothetical protein
MHKPALGAKPKPFIIQNLVIEVQAPSLQDMSSMDENDVECAHIANRQAEILMTFLTNGLESVLTDRVGGTCSVPWGPEMLSRVREITIVRQGKIEKKYDISASAAALGVELYQSCEQISCLSSGGESDLL